MGVWGPEVLGGVMVGEHEKQVMMMVMVVALGKGWGRRGGERAA